MIDEVIEGEIFMHFWIVTTILPCCLNSQSEFFMEMAKQQVLSNRYEFAILYP
jgi:hypothetical protein